MQPRVAVLGGSFRVQTEPARRSVTLVADSGDSRMEVRFQGVMQHALPERIRDPGVVNVSSTTGPRSRRLFEIRSLAGSWRIEADSVQVHEYPALFGRVVVLPRFPLRQRVLWGLLLWVARFQGGRALIGRLTSRKRRATR